MAFKTFYFTLWMHFVLFIVVNGSCLEYGHSCWGAHGKRSGNNKMIYYKDIKTPTEVDFQELNGISEKNTYDSTEEQTNDITDSLSVSHDINKDNEELVEMPDKNSIKYQKFLYKKPNKTVIGKQRNLELSEHQMKKSNNMPMPMISERWRRLPLYNLQRVQIARPENEWLRQLDQEQQINEDDYI